jgi:hypothetical protein
LSWKVEECKPLDVGIKVEYLNKVGSSFSTEQP